LEEHLVGAMPQRWCHDPLGNLFPINFAVDTQRLDGFICWL
jgi:hypothetical protein